jgi:phosphatidylserine decarboxylase
MRFDRAGLPFILGAFALAVVFAAARIWILAVPLIALVAFFAFFFRDPSRVSPSSGTDDVVLSPADGRVLVAGPAAVEAAPAGEWLQISIFLSPMDVHVNRMPASGRVTRVSYTPGKYLAAFKPDAATTNERSEIWIDHRGQPIVARQIVGFLARRVVCRVEAGADVRAGDRFGVMKFGSRMDVFVPPTATLAVTVGQKVRGGETVIAVLHSTT